MSVASLFERQMLDLIYAERTSRGLDPLALELRLNTPAKTTADGWMTALCAVTRGLAGRIQTIACAQLGFSSRGDGPAAKTSPINPNAAQRASRTMSKICTSP